MKKAELIGNVLLMVSGGRPTADMSVREYDVRSLLGPAINMAIDEGDDKNREDGNDRDYLSEFYGTYTDVPIDQSGSIAVANLTEGTVPLKGNNGIRAVYDNCGNFYGKLSDADRSTVNYYSCQASGMGWYYRLGNKLQLYGINPLAEKINYDALTSVDALGDEAELPLVAGTEARAIQLLYGLVTGQIQNPYDPKMDHDDINKANV